MMLMAQPSICQMPKVIYTISDAIDGLDESHTSTTERGCRGWIRQRRPRAATLTRLWQAPIRLPTADGMKFRNFRTCFYQVNTRQMSSSPQGQNTPVSRAAKPSLTLLRHRNHRPQHGDSGWHDYRNQSVKKCRYRANRNAVISNVARGCTLHRPPNMWCRGSLDKRIFS